MSEEAIVQAIINSGVLGIFLYLTITKIEGKLDKLIEEIHELVVATKVGGTK
jgi:hypothetical protein